MHGWFCFGKESNSSRRVKLKIELLKIELELNNLNSILSRSAVTPVFPDVSPLRVCVCVRAKVCVCVRDRVSECVGQLEVTGSVSGKHSPSDP